MGNQLFNATLSEAGKFTAKEFKIHIEKLMPKYESGSVKNFTEDISSKLVNSEGCKNTQLKLRNYVDAKSKTDYAIRMDAVNVWDMESAQGVTTEEVQPGSQDHTDDPEVVNPVVPMVIQGSGVGSGVGSGGGVPGPVATTVTTQVTITTQHNHKITEPMQFTGMELTNLHNYDTSVGDVLLVAMITEKDYAVLQIEGYIPQDGDESDNKWGK